MWDDNYYVAANPGNAVPIANSVLIIENMFQAMAGVNRVLRLVIKRQGTTVVARIIKIHPRCRIDDRPDILLAVAPEADIKYRRPGKEPVNEALTVFAVDALASFCRQTQRLFAIVSRQVHRRSLPHRFVFSVTRLAMKVMGILNLTPDSFSDGGAYGSPEAAIAAGRAMLAAGADILDIGAESTRPGAAPVPPREEQARLLPVLRALAEAGATISLDTRNAETMRMGLAAGVAIINDVSALRHDPAAAALLAGRDCQVILMHMRGTPATMAAHATYADVVTEVAAELAARRDAAVAAGIAPGRIWLDPGLGFAKTTAHNVALLRHLGALRALGHGLVIGASRKCFIEAVAGPAAPTARLGGSIAAALAAADAGADILRVHDVHETVQALRVWHRLRPCSKPD